jgi:hypothetical protein
MRLWPIKLCSSWQTWDTNSWTYVVWNEVKGLSWIVNCRDFERKCS